MVPKQGLADMTARDQRIFVHAKLAHRYAVYAHRDSRPISLGISGGKVYGLLLFADSRRIENYLERLYTLILKWAFQC